MSFRVVWKEAVSICYFFIATIRSFHASWCFEISKLCFFLKVFKEHYVRFGLFRFVCIHTRTHIHNSFVYICVSFRTSHFCIIFFLTLSMLLYALVVFISSSALLALCVYVSVCLFLSFIFLCFFLRSIYTIYWKLFLTLLALSSVLTISPLFSLLLAISLWCCFW